MLVDRVWPHGLTKAAVQFDELAKLLAAAFADATNAALSHTFGIADPEQHGPLPRTPRLLVREWLTTLRCPSDQG